jgi:hypothetical protein
MDMDALYASNDRMNKTFNVEGFEVFSSSNFSDCVRKTTQEPFILIFHSNI